MAEELTAVTVDIEGSDVDAGRIILKITVGNETCLAIPLDAKAAVLFADKFTTAYLTAFGDRAEAAMRQEPINIGA